MSSFLTDVMLKVLDSHIPFFRAKVKERIIENLATKVEPRPRPFFGNIPYQDTLRDVTGYRHCRFVVISLTQTAIDSIVDSLVLLFVVDFSLRKISFQLL